MFLIKKHSFKKIVSPTPYLGLSFEKSYLPKRVKIQPDLYIKKNTSINLAQGLV